MVLIKNFINSQTTFNLSTVVLKYVYQTVCSQYDYRTAFVHELNTTVENDLLDK